MTKPMKPAEFRAIRIIDLDMTQEELAGSLDVARHTVGRWERGTQPISRTAEYALYWLAYGEHDE